MHGKTRHYLLLLYATLALIACIGVIEFRLFLMAVIAAGTTASATIVEKLYELLLKRPYASGSRRHFFNGAAIVLFGVAFVSYFMNLDLGVSGFCLGLAVYSAQSSILESRREIE